jgi:hypothetical protein
MRLVLWIDALVEAVLAACCIALAVANPRDGGWRLPGYLNAGLVLLLAAALLVVVAVLWWLGRRPRREVLLLVCVANAVTAVAAVWYAVVLDAGTGIRLLVIGSAVALVVLAVSEAFVARRS